MPRRLKKWVKNTLLIFGSIFVSIIIGLSILIVFEMNYISKNQSWHDPNTEFDSYLGWVPIKNRSVVDFDGKIVSSNELGFRSEKVNHSKNHILVLGDSVAWGYGVNDNETVTYYLNNLVEEDLQILNLAVSGYGIDQYYMHLKQKIKETNPTKVIIIIYTGNDLTDTRKSSVYSKSKPLFVLENDELVNINENISRYSCFNIVSKSYIINNFNFLKKTKNKICKLKTTSIDDVKIIVEKLLIEIEKITEEYNVDLHYVLSPSLDDYSKKEREDSFKLKFFIDVMEKKNYSYINIHDIFENPDSLYIENDSVHYNPKGNKLLAETIYDSFIS
jgi:lysophospholipase L1-like esterase